MAKLKKEFRGIDSVFNNDNIDNINNNVNSSKINNTINTVNNVNTEPSKRATFIIFERHLDNIDNYAYWERLKKQDVVNKALDLFFKDKSVKPRVK